MTKEQLLQTGLDHLYAKHFKKALAVFEQAMSPYRTRCDAHFRKEKASQALVGVNSRRSIGGQDD